MAVSAAQEGILRFDVIELEDEGLAAIKAIKQERPHQAVIVDLNSAAGEQAACEIFQAGADLVRISGETKDSTIVGAVRAAAAHYKGIVVDLSEVQDKWARAKEVLDLGVAFVEFLPGLMSKPTRAMI